MLKINLNTQLSRVFIVMISFIASSCSNQKSINQPNTPPVVEAPTQITPITTDERPYLLAPIEDHCAKDETANKSLASVNGVLLINDAENLSTLYLYNLMDNTKQEISIPEDTQSFDVAVSPNQKLIALTILNSPPPPIETKELLIINSIGVIQKSFTWKDEWGRIAAWLDDHQVLIAKQTDLQLSVYNPETVILLDINTGADVEIHATYPELNDFGYVNWNLINYVYSPDLARVLYPTSKVDQNHINQVAFLNTETNKVLATLPVELSETSLPEWSPDGSKVLVSGLVEFKDDKSRNWLGQELFTLTRDGTVSQITDFARFYPNQIYIEGYTWSPNGKQIAFWLSVGQFQLPQLVLLNAETGRTVNFCISGLPFKASSNLMWSPSGQYLALNFKKDLGETSQILLIDVLNERIIKTVENSRALSWLDKLP